MKRYVIGIEDVARRAKVSVMTVSRAFNKPDAVLPSTRERINAAIREIGYVPNQVAGSLRKQRSNIVAVIIPDIDNSMFSSLLRGISNTLHQAGLTLMLGDSQYSAMNEEETIFSLLRQRPCGLILHSTKHSLRAIRMMEKSGIPIVETGTLTQTPVDMVVSYSNIDGARTVTRHLLDRGYERIGYIGLRSEANERAVERREGFCEVLRDAGIAIDPGYMVETDSGLGAGGAALMQLLRPHPKSKRYSAREDCSRSAPCSSASAVASKYRANWRSRALATARWPLR